MKLLVIIKFFIFKLVNKNFLLKKRNNRLYNINLNKSIII